MICDFHVHTRLSADSSADIDEVISQAIGLGMPYLCITDHHDINYDSGEEGLSFLLDPEEYYQTLSHFKEKYQGKINLLIGVEMGLQPHIQEEVSRFLNAVPFDFVIGSSHVINGMDPYYKTIWKEHSREEVMQLYFENIYQNLQVHDNFDVYGHLDYAIRYAGNKDENYHYAQYQDILDRILKKIISMGKGIEVNTAGLSKGLHSTNPSEEIVSRYHELGGKIITIGSDAHVPQMIGSCFPEAKALIRRCGFDGYYLFKQRNPLFVEL